jgi:hypothetical protein
MNIQNANTEPFYRLHRFHEEFNRSMRVAFGSIEALRLDSKQATKPVVLPTGGEPWGNETKWREVSKVLAESTRFLSQVALVRVLSAFEDFLVKVVAEHDRYLHLCDPNHQAEAREGSEKASMSTRLKHVCNLLKADEKQLKDLLPLLEYFAITRNCVVHRSSRASTELIEHSESKGFLKTCSSLTTPRGKRSPALPDLTVHLDIKLLPRHSILASGLFHRAGKVVNSWLISVLGDKGVVHMAAFHSLLGDELIPTNAFRSPAHVINGALFGRYLVRDISANDATNMLKEMGKWDQCRRRYRAIYATDGENKKARD